MKTYLNFLIISIWILMCMGCSKHENKDNISTSMIVGDWAFLAQDSTYGEVYINDSMITFYTESYDQVGPSRYKIKDDSLSYYGIQYKISTPDCKVVILENSEILLKLEKIDLRSLRDTNQINPFYLRRCNFLVHKGIIKTDDAIVYLSSIQVPEKIEEVEFTPIRRSSESK